MRCRMAWPFQCVKWSKADLNYLQMKYRIECIMSGNVPLEFMLWWFIRLNPNIVFRLESKAKKEYLTKAKWIRDWKCILAFNTIRFVHVFLDLTTGFLGKNDQNKIWLNWKFQVSGDRILKGLHKKGDAFPYFLSKLNFLA